MTPVTSYETLKNAHFWSHGRPFWHFGHNSGPRPLRTNILGPGESSHIVGPGRVLILNLIFFLEMNAGSEKGTLNM